MHTHVHIYLQASAKGGKTKNNVKATTQFSKRKMLLLLNGLSSYVKKLHVKKNKSTWDDYYVTTILSNQYLQNKTSLVTSFLNTITFTSIVDLGANDGYFSLLFKNTPTRIVE